MSNSMARTPESPFLPSLTPGLRIKLLAILSLAFLIELASRLLPRIGDSYALLAEGMSVAAILLACTSIAMLVSHTRCGRAVRAIMTLAAIALSISIILRICTGIPAMDTLPLLGARGVFHDLLINLADLAGIAAWVFGFFWMVFELQTTREVQAIQYRQLAEEIDGHNRAETVLRESEGRFRAVFNNVPASILVMSPQGRLVECNRALAAELGYSLRQLHDTALESLVREEDRQNFRAALGAIQGAPAVNPPFEIRLVARDARPIHFAITATLVRPDTRRAGIVVAVLENVSERRLREQQIQRRQKMESLEILAGGMAHDLNNLLVGIMANADLLAQLPDAPKGQAQTYRDIIQSSQRAAELCHQLLAYAGKTPRQEQAVNLTELVESSAQLFRLALAPLATMTIRGTPDLPAISADPAHLRQVLLSLIANASDAILGEAGNITLSTGLEELEESDFARLLHEHDPEPGPYVYLEVADRGVGMSEEAIGSIFDPFYSTKGQGSGLGLAAARGIVHAHRGLMSITSSPNQGATFRIYFPAVSQPAISLGSIPEAKPPRAAKSMDRTVLVVDDEAVVRDAARRILEHRGYGVILAVDGQEGIEIFEARHAELSAVLLDLTMPRMNGETACARMRAIDPKVPIILSSGYSESENTSAEIFREVAAYLRKPYRLKQLLDILEEVT